LGVFLLLFYYLIFKNRKIISQLSRIASIQWINIGIITVFIILTFFIYPVADARKAIGKGSTGDDAIIEPVKQLLSSGKLYDVKLYDGAPVSPGPGWILLNAPFVVFNCYYLFTPMYLLASIFLISFATTICLHFIFYSTSDYYQPLHLLNRGKNNIGVFIIVLGILISLTISLIAAFKVQKSFESFSTWFFILMAVPLSLIAFGKLLNVNNNFAGWEGANYIAPVIPLFLFYVSHKYACTYAELTKCNVG